MNEVQMMSPSKVAEQYGGDKRKIAQAVQVGVIDPTVGVMAGMFIDRVRNAALAEQTPHQTVAQQVLAPQQPQMAAQQPQMPPQAGLQAAAASPVDRGLAALPVDESMVPGGEGYAGGGIIAFDGTEGSAVGGGIDYRLLSQLTDPEREVYYRTGELPYRLKYPNGTPLGDRNLRDVPVWEDVQLGGVAPGMTSTDMLLGRYETKPESKVAAAATKAATEAAQKDTAPAGPTPEAAATSSLADSIRAAKAGAPERLTPEKYKELQEKFGISDKADKAVQSIIEKLSGSATADRETAKNMALAQAGFAMMGGTSPYAMQNIGKGAMEGIAQYGRDIKDIKGAEREISKLQIEQAKAEEARARGDFKDFEARNEKIDDHLLKLEKLGVDKAVAQATIAHQARPGTYAELGAAAEKYPWLKDRFTAGAENAETTRAKTALAAIDAMLMRMKSNDPRRKDLEAKQDAIFQQLLGTAGISGSGGTAADPLGLRGGR